MLRGATADQDRNVCAEKAAQIEQFAFEIGIVGRINDAERHDSRAILQCGAGNLGGRKTRAEIHGPPALLSCQRRGHDRAQFVKLPLRRCGHKRRMGVLAGVLPGRI